MSGGATHGAPGPSRQRWGIVAGTVLAGMLALAWSLNVDPGSAAFYLATAALAIVWFVGAALAGPGPVGDLGVVFSPRWRIVEPFALALALALLFVVGGLIVRQVDALAEAVDEVLDYARRGSGPLVAVLIVGTAVAEEVLFRGALYDALPRRHAVAASTAVYVLATAASGSAMLAFAALVLGVVLGIQRRATDGFAGPAITHATWSVTMLVVLPLVVTGD